MPPPTIIISIAIALENENNKRQRYEILGGKYQLIIRYLMNFRPSLGYFFVALCSLFLASPNLQGLAKLRGKAQRLESTD
jgi:hypothetical protein